MIGISTLPPLEKKAKLEQLARKAATSRSSINSVDISARKAALDAYEERKFKQELEL